MSAARQQRYRIRRKLYSMYRNSLAYTIIQNYDAKREDRAIHAAIDALSYETPERATKLFVDTLIGFTVVAYIYGEKLSKTEEQP